MRYTPEEAAKLLANRINQPHYIAFVIRKCIAEARETEAAAAKIIAHNLRGERDLKQK